MINLGKIWVMGGFWLGVTCGLYFALWHLFFDGVPDWMGHNGLIEMGIYMAVAAFAGAVSSKMLFSPNKRKSLVRGLAMGILVSLATILIASLFALLVEARNHSDVNAFFLIIFYPIAIYKILESEAALQSQVWYFLFS